MGGDSADNIPGCPGVGEKTAIKLLHQFGSIENLLENNDQLKGALKNKIEENRDQILFSKFLATIKTDVPIEVRENDFIRKEMDKDALQEIFEELEFRTLITRVFKQDFQKKKNQTNLYREISFRCLTTLACRKKLNYCLISLIFIPLLINISWYNRKRRW